MLGLCLGLGLEVEFLVLTLALGSHLEDIDVGAQSTLGGVKTFLPENICMKN